MATNLALSFLNRRHFVAASVALMASTAVPKAVFAQAAATAPAGPDSNTPSPFSFELLTARMKAKAKADFVSGAIKLPPFIAGLSYDDYQKIQFRPERSRWTEKDSLFRLQAFHMGWLFKLPVQLFNVVDGKATHVEFTTADFNYYNPALDDAKKTMDLPGIAGFRLNYPLNAPDVFDEVVAFLGSSYFRALGRGNTYGLSARGLAIDTGLPGGEEFPYFSEFYLDQPAPGAKSVVACAALDSQSCTGAYRFEIVPGAPTLITVEAKLFFRKDVKQLGVAPLTSMFLFAGNNRSDFDDYRPQVHDSDGLLIESGDGEVIWRQLNNPAVLANSYFAEQSPRAFGLMQRQRQFSAYEDASAHYERRPSVRVEPIGDWGKGTVLLLELPSKFEYNDNIVASWKPDVPIKAGEEHDFSYRLYWGDLDPDPDGALAFVSDTRTGPGGASTTKPDPSLRKFVIDFSGGTLSRLTDDTKIKPIVNVTGGTVQNTALFRVAANGVHRLVLDVKMTPDKTVELNAHLQGFGQRLTETWLYQWRISK